MILPPLPLVQEMQAIVQFLLDCVDDACEDVLKLLLLTMIWNVAAWFTTTDIRLSRRSRMFACGALLLAVYPYVDEMTDRTADKTIHAQNAVRSLFGQPLKVPEPDDEVSDAPMHLQAVDDMVEDSFKFICIAGHAYMGYIAGAALQTSIPGEGMLEKIAGAVVSVGTPASQYQACDCYGDALGDAVQSWLAQKMGYRVGVQKAPASCWAGQASK